MRPLSVFLSSTCYDLKSLREHLRAEIAALGHDPVLSEYPSFPVVPDLSTVENCKRVVRERADVLLLVVGGKRGSLDPETNKSVVNSEYREARAAGLDCFVFVDKQVWDLLPHHRRNPDADFSPTVDNPAVFAFLEDIIADTKWVFPFIRTEEILAILRVQFSTRFRDLLVRARENRLVVPYAFAGESSHIQRIAIDKPPAWEFQLACELLRDRIKRLDAKFNDLDSGFVTRRTRFLPARATTDYIHDLLEDLVNTIQALSLVLSDQLTPAFGPLGVPGDADKIKAACDNVYSLCLTLFEWELDVRFVRAHDVFQGVFVRMHGWTADIRAQLASLPARIEAIFSNPQASGDHTITLTFSAPAGVDALVEEFDRLSADPGVLAAMRSSP